MIHHIAIGTANPAELADFYVKIPNAKKSKEWWNEDGSLRSVWIQMGNIILMIEKGKKMGPRALVFSYRKKDHAIWETLLAESPLTHRTDFTLYFDDPDGNSIGISAYPEPLEI